MFTWEHFRNDAWLCPDLQSWNLWGRATGCVFINPLGDSDVPRALRTIGLNLRICIISYTLSSSPFALVCFMCPLLIAVSQKKQEIPHLVLQLSALLLLCGFLRLVPGVCPCDVLMRKSSYYGQIKMSLYFICLTQGFSACSCTIVLQTYKLKSLLCTDISLICFPSSGENSG